jgi:hypothetical protein
MRAMGGVQGKGKGKGKAKALDLDDEDEPVVLPYVASSAIRHMTADSQ